MTRRGLTLIEMLIAVAIIAVMSAGLVLSFSDIAVRSRVIEASHHAAMEIDNAVDAIAGDASTSTSHRTPDHTTLLLESAGRTTEYRFDDGSLERTIQIGEREVSVVLISDRASGEFRSEDNGLHVSLTSGFNRWHREVLHTRDVFIAWPEVVGVISP